MDTGNMKPGSERLKPTPGSLHGTPGLLSFTPEPMFACAVAGGFHSRGPTGPPGRGPHGGRRLAAQE